MNFRYRIKILKESLFADVDDLETIEKDVYDRETERDIYTMKKNFNVWSKKIKDFEIFLKTKHSNLYNYVLKFLQQHNLKFDYFFIELSNRVNRIIKDYNTTSVKKLIDVLERLFQKGDIQIKNEFVSIKIADEIYFSEEMEKVLKLFIEFVFIK